jgi:hypothetical protein
LSDAYRLHPARRSLHSDGISPLGSVSRILFKLAAIIERTSVAMIVPTAATARNGRMRQNFAGGIISTGEAEVGGAQTACSSAMQPGDRHACISYAREPTNPIVSDALLVIVRIQPDWRICTLTQKPFRTFYLIGKIRAIERDASR